MIITVGSNKGGTGKTTTATNIAIALASKEKDVCLIDADFQRSSSKWYQDRQESQILPTVILVERYDNISNTIEELNKKFDIPIILNNINQEVTYEGDFSDTRIIIWTLDFTVKGFIEEFINPIYFYFDVSIRRILFYFDPKDKEGFL